MSQLQLPGTDTPKPSLKDEPLKWAMANPTPTILAGLVVLGMMSGGLDQASESVNQRGSINEFRDNAAFSIDQEKERMKLREDQFKIAVQRQQTCLKVTLDGEDTPANVAPGLVFRDPSSGSPFPAGTFVCDRYGATAVLDANGVMGNIMFGLPDPGVTIKGKPQPVQVETPKEVILYAPATN
jgi:hypothetical protein